MSQRINLGCMLINLIDVMLQYPLSILKLIILGCVVVGKMVLDVKLAFLVVMGRGEKLSEFICLF